MFCMGTNNQKWGDICSLAQWGETIKLVDKHLKGFCKLASQVLYTQVPYQTRALKARFHIAELETLLPHKS